MNKNHYKRKKIFAILAVIMTITFCLWNEQVSFAAEMDISSYAKQTNDLSELVPDASNFSSSASIQESTIPAFLLVITNGEDSYVTSAFYVEDTFGSGATYLVTSNLAAMFMEEGFEMYIVRGDYDARVEEVYLDSSENLAFLAADGVETYEPLQMTNPGKSMRSSLAWLTVDKNQNFYMGFEELNMDDWMDEGGIYITDGQIEDLVYFGAPVIDLDSLNVWGMMYGTSDFYPVIFDINYVSFPEEAAIMTGNSSSETEDEPQSDEEPVQPDSEEPRPQMEESSKGDTMKYALIAMAVVAVAGFLKNKKKQKKDVSSEYREGTVPLYEEQKTEPIQPVKEEPVRRASYQIRGLSGVFEGQLFEIRGAMKFGRSHECQISYPPKTGGISGMHCHIEEETEGVILRDLNSTYGTFYNGTKMQAQMDYHLKLGDVFYLGDKRESFRVEECGEYRQVFTPVVKAVAEPEAGAFYHANTEKKMYFGRGDNCQVKFEETCTAISTRHCVLYRDNTGLYLVDLGSVNGTFLSENLRLKPHVPYRMEKGRAFFLASPKYTFVITED